MDTVPEDERESRFVFIGKNLDHELLREGFMACRVTEKLRFSKGTTVEANVGTFQKGKIVNHWDEGNAYRIELDNSDKVNGKLLMLMLLCCHTNIYDYPQLIVLQLTLNNILVCLIFFVFILYIVWAPIDIDAYVRLPKSDSIA